VVRAFVIRSLTRRLGRLYFVAVGLMVVSFVMLVLRGERGWVVGFMLAGILFGVGVVAAMFLANSRNTIGRFRQMRSPEATFGFTDDQFTITSELGSATMPRSAVTEVWKFPPPAQFITLPLDSLSEEAQSFILSKTKAE
jgi:hypothetical protein